MNEMVENTAKDIEELKKKITYTSGLINSGKLILAETPSEEALEELARI